MIEIQYKLYENIERKTILKEGIFESKASTYLAEQELADFLLTQFEKKQGLILEIVKPNDSNCMFLLQSKITAKMYRLF